MAPLPISPNQKFGMLTAVKFVGRDKYSIALWEFICACGQITIIPARSAYSGSTKSCGCQWHITSGTRTHGMAGTKIHKTWIHLRDRCNNPKCNGFENYGGRGITFCSEWESFEAFYEDMGDPPSGKHSIDRIDNNLGYCKENCRWATPEEQAGNKRSNIMVTLNNRTQCLEAWARELNVSYARVWVRYHNLGWSAEDSLLLPCKYNGKDNVY